MVDRSFFSLDIEVILGTICYFHVGPFMSETLQLICRRRIMWRSVKKLPLITRSAKFISSLRVEGPLLALGSHYYHSLIFLGTGIS